MAPSPLPAESLPKSQESLPARFWGEVSRAAGLNAAREQGNLSVPAFHGVAPEQGALSQLPAEQGQVLIGQARAFAKSEFAFSNGNGEGLAHVQRVLEGLPGGQVADVAEAKTARFLGEFDSSVRVRVEREKNMAIPAFKAETAKVLLNNEFSPGEAAWLLTHFQAFTQSPYADVTRADKTLLAELQVQNEQRVALTSAKQERVPIVQAGEKGSYQIRVLPEQA